MILAAYARATPTSHTTGGQVRGSGRSLLQTLFGPSIARTIVSYSGNQKVGTIIINRAAAALSRARKRPGPELRHRGGTRGHGLERCHPDQRQARVAGLDAARGDAAALGPTYRVT